MIFSINQKICIFGYVFIDYQALGEGGVEERKGGSDLALIPIFKRSANMTIAVTQLADQTKIN